MSKPTTELTMDTAPKGEMLFDVGSLLAHVAGRSDPRKTRGVRYSLVHLLIFLILAQLGGEAGMKGMSEWVKIRGAGLVSLLDLERASLPHQTTYERLIEKLDIDEFERAVGNFFAQNMSKNITVTIDGKVLRGTIATGETQGVHLLAVLLANPRPHPKSLSQCATRERDFKENAFAPLRPVGEGAGG